MYCDFESDWERSGSLQCGFDISTLEGEIPEKVVESIAVDPNVGTKTDY